MSELDELMERTKALVEKWGKTELLDSSKMTSEELVKHSVILESEPFTPVDTSEKSVAKMPL